jgi:hypothetical protein
MMRAASSVENDPTSSCSRGGVGQRQSLNRHTNALFWWAARGPSGFRRPGRAARLQCPKFVHILLTHKVRPVRKCLQHRVQVQVTIPRLGGAGGSSAVSQLCPLHAPVRF